MAAGGPVMVAAPSMIKENKYNKHGQALGQEAILTGIQHYSIAVVATAAIIPLMLLRSMGGEPMSTGSSVISKRMMQQRLLCYAAAAFCVALVLAAPTAADLTGTVCNTPGGIPINVRDSPHVSGNLITTIPDGNTVVSSCYTPGDNVNGDTA